MNIHFFSFDEFKIERNDIFPRGGKSFLETMVFSQLPQHQPTYDTYLMNDG